MLTTASPATMPLADVRSPALTGPVLVAIDGRSEADSALRAAKLIAAERGAALTVLSVVPMVPIVSPEIHSRTLARTLAHAKLVVLPGIGHAVQHVAADVVVAEIDRLAAQ